MSNEKKYSCFCGRVLRGWCAVDRNAFFLFLSNLKPCTAPWTLVFLTNTLIKPFRRIKKKNIMITFNNQVSWHERKSTTQCKNFYSIDITPCSTSKLGSHFARCIAQGDVEIGRVMVLYSVAGPSTDGGAVRGPIQMGGGAGHGPVLRGTRAMHRAETRELRCRCFAF